MNLRIAKAVLYRLFVPALLFPAAVSCFGQTPSSRVYDWNKHAWYSYSGDHPVKGPWGLHFDGQWRRSELGATWQQFQLRPGLNYKVSDNLLLTLGYVYTRTYPYGDFPVRAAFPEHRIYQQAVVRHRAGALRMQHRIRWEERFIRYPSPQPESWTYQNRFRYLIKADIPLSGGDDSELKWYLPVYDEIVIGVPPNYGFRPFDQNRVFVGIGRNLGVARFEVGYLNQFLGQRNGRIFESNNTLFVTLTSDVPLSSLWR